MAEKKNFIELLQKMKARRQLWLDRLSLTKIFIIWAVVVCLFGVFFYIFSSQAGYLVYNLEPDSHVSFIDTIYFSFVTATNGFGSIVPAGYFKIVAMLEIVLGLFVLAIITSKLVSIKQDVILDEIYEISFNERISRIRSSLLLFRQNLGRILSRIEDSTVRKRELNDFYLYLSNFEDTLNEIINFICRPGNRIFSKSIDKVNSELILNSILSSFEKIHELTASLNDASLEWKRETTLFLIDRCISINEGLFKDLKQTNIVPEQTLRRLEDQKIKIIEDIRQEVIKNPLKSNPL